MTYSLFSYTNPETSQTRQDMVDSSRHNLLALRDAVVAGAMEGWNMDVGDSSSTATATWTSSLAVASEPGLIRYRKGTEEILLWITWTSSSPTVIKHYYSPNYSSGYPANRDSIGTETITYDGSFNVTAVTWT